MTDEYTQRKESFEEARQRVAVENDRALRQRLTIEFRVPPEFLDLAVRIWWDGKED